ncbi:transcription/translation regulatory transformer protein RfaH [Marinobacter nanhaiticus D15-8W]|uniref:Transcription/translation regulatory transformer protein RfaH n=1 Tax=Marinobacter nanhaiticus D15-8W TaxID=626887 RepID=N6WX54_9GAMM|nr:transcription/translation regulatory transformer protein RfaH [Marinobacter nanhaiticus]ENO13408.1 transcription/translation regulatory transformer protein RfaH [Marinobacter nanhaiticus D15-8W]BES70775.1 transcription/translation regulatory transformer protein RfaH [Marinobacter nanhaiticus D15-8W]
MTWYVLRHKPNQGDRAVEHLQSQEVACFYPKIEVEKVKAGRRFKRLEALFPGYIFFRMEPDDPQWAKLRSTRGVLRVVSFAGNPAPVGDDVIAQIKEGMQAIAERGGMKPGQPIEIQEGPFKGFSAIFQTYDGDTRAIVLLEFLQKQQRVRMPVSSIKR